MGWTCAACMGANPDGTRFCGLCGVPRAVASAGEGDGAPRAAVDPATSMVADALRGLVLATSAEPPTGGTGRTLRDERRLVTAVFADISGFSELTDRLDPEQLLEVIDPVVAALSNVVGRYDGIIEKFAGDALMALFGAPVAHDDDAVRALHVALDMHAELARQVSHLPAEAAGLRLHAGVNSGHGIGRIIGSEVRFDYAVLGDVVVLAQRLEAAAPTGQTYVGETTYHLARHEFEFEALGALSMKGKDRPVAAWRLVGPRRRHVAMGDGSGDGDRLVGRDGELATILGFAARLDEGRGGAVFVVGEPGIGKTALCHALRERVDEAGWEWLAARCLSYGGDLAYWPFADLFRGLLGVTDAAVDGALHALRSALAALSVEEALPFIGALCGVAGTPATDLTPETFQTRLRESVIAVLSARATSRPVVLHVDDLHWADQATLGLIGDLLTAMADAPLLVLATARPGSGTTLDGLVARIPAASVVLRLDSLSETAVRHVATRILGAPAAPGLAAALLEHTRGNPFFVEEVTRSLRERGALVEEGGEWQTSTPWDGDQVPVTVEGVVGARVDALPDGQRAALEVLSVVGRRSDLRLARAVAAEIDATLPGLVAAGLVEPVDGDQARFVAFHHPLTQQVVYSRLLRRRRAELHRAVGEAAESLLETDEAAVDLLARHFLLGERPAKAFDYLLRAAARAERLFANDQAVAHLRQALDLELAATGAQARRPELLLRCAQLEEVRGAYDAALALYTESLELTGEVQAAAGRASTLRKLGEYTASLETIEASRAAHAGLSATETAMLSLEEGWVLGLTGGFRKAVDVLRNGLAAVGGLDEPIEADLLLLLARSEEMVGSHPEALGHAEAALRLVEQREDLPRLARVLRVLGGVQDEVAATDPTHGGQARGTLERALLVARRVGNAEEEAAALVNLAQVLEQAGMIDDAIARDRESAAAFERVGLKAGIACAYCNLAAHTGAAGRWDESLAAADHALPIARQIGNVFWTTGALIGIAQARTALGAFAEACAAADEAVEVATAHGHARRAVSALRAAAAARRGLGDNAAAEALLARALALDPQSA